jgi:NitT/TauT family transport system permease protein
MAVHDRELTQLSSGLDALETVSALEITRGRKLWNATWPKLLAVAIVLGFWQFLIWVHWRPEYAFAPPSKVFASLWNNWSVIWQATTKTLSRAFQGYALALAIGVGLGALVSRIAVLRAAIGSMVTGLQTMPSVAWFPLAAVMFHLSEGSITFVVVLGAFPAIANGLINGVDNISPVLLRAGRVMGARRLAAFWHVVLPAALPSFVGGLKQGWAFAWRSLLAAEVIGGIPGFSLGQQLQAGRDFGKVEDVMAVMVVIFVIGVLMDSFVFGFFERGIRTRYGLVDQALAA